MIKSHHSLFLETLDYVLGTIDNPCLNYTVPKELITKVVEPKLVFDKIYKDVKSKFLIEGFDKSTEYQAKKYLIDSALDHLSVNRYINTHKNSSGETVYQITHKGLLKIHLGFTQSFKNDGLKLDNLKTQTNFENLMKVLTVLIPALLSFFLGKLL